jgi:hypothetical protein
VIRRRCLARGGLEAPLGFLPFQGYAADRLADELTPPAPLTRFAETPPKARTGRRIRVSLSDRLARLTPHQRTNEDEPGNPPRVLVPVRSNGLRAAAVRAYEFT